MKKFISLLVGIFAFFLLIQPIFATNDADLQTLINDETVIACSDQLVADYASLDASGVTNYMRIVVADYYENDFTEEYQSKNDGLALSLQAKLDTLDNKGVYLQYHYLANNPAVLGAKDGLDDAKDGSAWSATHADCHPNLSASLTADGSYDYFVIDAHGNIVYTVYKETDLGTNLTSGSFSDSELGQAYAGSVAARALVLADSYATALTVSDVAAYWPSYEDAAQFVCSPIGEAGTTFCLQITPDQLGYTGDIRYD